MPDSMAYLCPVQAYAEWLEASEIESGYVFRRLGSGDRVSENNQPMVRFDFRARALSARCASSLRRATYSEFRLLVMIDGRVLLGDVPKQFDRHRRRPRPLWHPLVPAWWVPVVLR
ncbi:hypothetical protein EDB85DRAFT_1251823 [Lactarius pseudohatsudake]|nr:hypothetical protein EDB85DRAFT_1251823 [Lactarius pseudohatsudake]